MNSTLKHRLILLAVLASVAAVGAYAWTTLRQQGPGEGFVSGNGRIEATEIDVAAKLGGRVQSIVVKEGDFVTAGQPLVHMQIDTLQASHDEARARHQQAVAAVANAEAQVAVRESDRQAGLALVAQRQSELDAAQGAWPARRRWCAKAPRPTRKWTTTVPASAACKRPWWLPGHRPKPHKPPSRRRAPR